MTVTEEGDEIVLHFNCERDVNCVVLEEDISKGQSVFEFDINVNYNEELNIPYRYTVFRGATIGKKSICSFPTVYARSLKIKIKNHDGDYKINSVKAYKY